MQSQNFDDTTTSPASASIQASVAWVIGLPILPIDVSIYCAQIIALTVGIAGGIHCPQCECLPFLEILGLDRMQSEFKLQPTSNAKTTATIHLNDFDFAPMRYTQWEVLEILRELTRTQSRKLGTFFHRPL
jgi:hypothetical protein